MNSLLPELHEGHAPFTLQQLFRDALEAYDDWEDNSPVPVVFHQGLMVPVDQVFDRMRECTDILPNNLISAVKERLTKPWHSESPLEEMTFSTAARVMSILVRKRLMRHGEADIGGFIERLETQSFGHKAH